MLDARTTRDVAGLNSGDDRDEYPGGSSPESEGHRLKALVDGSRRKPPVSLPQNVADEVASTRARTPR